MDKEAFEKVKKEVESEIFPTEDETEQKQEERIDWILNKAREAGYENLGALAATLYKNLGMAMPSPVGGGPVGMVGKAVKKIDPKKAKEVRNLFERAFNIGTEKKMKKGEDLLEGIQESIDSVVTPSKINRNISR